MMSSFRHLPRSAALQFSRIHRTRPSVPSAPKIRGYSSGFGGNNEFASVTDSPTPEKKGSDLTKADLAMIIAAEYDIKTAESNRILNTLLDTIVEAVSKGGTVSISGFGKFSRKTLQPREYRNPSTGGSVLKGERHVPKFSAFANFKDCVGGKGEE